MMEVHLAVEGHKDLMIKCREDDTCIRCGGQAIHFRNNISFLNWLYYERHCQQCQDKG